MLVKTTIFFYSITNANIAKGERKDKRKSYFRFDYAEPHPILAANAANIEKAHGEKIVRFIFQFQYKFYYITERNFGKLYFIRHN